MTTATRIDSISFFPRFARAAAIFAALIGVLVLLGRTLDVAILKSFVSGLGDMKPNAALALILSALALWLLAGAADFRLLAGARILAALVVLLSLLTLVEHLSGRDLGIDQVLFLDPSAETQPGRMNPATALLILLLGVELSALGAALDARIAQSLAALTGAFALAALAGFLYGIPALYVLYGPLAPHLALGVLMLSLGALCARPGAGLLAALADDHTGAALFRWLPGAVGVPLALGFLILLGERRGFYDAELGLALFAFSSAVFFAVVIFRGARALGERDSARARDQRKLQRELARVRALGASERVIDAAPEPAAVPAVLLEQTESVFPLAAATTLRLVSRESGALEPAASRNRGGAPWTIDENQALGARAKKVVETKTPLAVRKLQTDGQVYNQVFRKQGFFSYLGVPLLARGAALGVLGVYTKEEHEFTPEEIDGLQRLAGRAAAALGRAEFQPAAAPQTEKSDAPASREPLQRLSRLLPGIYAALARLNTAELLREPVEAFIDNLIAATGAEAALIRVWKKETGAALVAAHRGFSEDHFKQMEIGLLGGALEWVVEHGEPIIAPEIAAEPRFKTKLEQQLGFRSCALLPLKINHEVRGVIHLASRKPGDFDESQKDLFTAIAQQMGVSMENRELFDHLKNSKENLEKASKVKDEFMSVMSHELRTPLAVVMGYAGMVKEKMLGEINEKQEDALQKLLTRANDQLNMINAIMQITQLESRALVIERHLVNLAELLGHLKSEYALSHTKEKVALVWNFPPEPLAIVTDSGKLKEILVNLINNAIKFTLEGTVTVSMRLTDDQRRRWVELKVADTGIGVAAEHMERIFEKFYQVDSSETRLYGGVGLGLYIVKHFTEFLGGRIRVASEPDKGSTFIVTIPYAP